MKKKAKTAKTKTIPRKKILLPILLVIVLILLFISIRPAEEKKTLPDVEAWSMKEIYTYSPEGFTIKEGIYKSGEKFVKLTIVLSDDETKTKNKLEAMAHQNIEAVKEETEAVVGKNEAKYISDEKFKIIYFVDNEKKGYIAISENDEHLKKFLADIHGNVFIDI